MCQEKGSCKDFTECPWHIVDFISVINIRLFFKFGLTPCKAKQHYKARSYKKKKYKKIKAYRKSLDKEPTVNRCQLILELKPFSL